MQRLIQTLTILVLAALIFTSSLFAQSETGNENKEVVQRERARMQGWYQWRGPLMNGEAPLAQPPLRWSESKNIKWKTRLAGLGHSTPIVTRDCVFVTLAREVGEKFAPRPDTAPGAHDNKLVSSKFDFVAVAISRATGDIKWQRVLNSAIPHEGGHVSASLASASPVTDGKYVWFYFGSYGLYCLDLNGDSIWSKDLGRMDSKHGHGEGASPVLSGGIIAINWDHEGQSFVAAFDKRSGSELWRKTVKKSLHGRRQLLLSIVVADN